MGLRTWAVCVSILFVSFVVAGFLDGRSGQQCLHRWLKCISPEIKRGRWTPEEDASLVEAVRRHGTSRWSTIQTMVPGRTDVQCRERWTNILDPSLQQGPWTPAEDKILIDLVRRHGQGRWSAVAAAMPTSRTDNQVKKKKQTVGYVG